MIEEEAAAKTESAAETISVTLSLLGFSVRGEYIGALNAVGLPDGKDTFTASDTTDPDEEDTIEYTGDFIYGAATGSGTVIVKYSDRVMTYEGELHGGLM